MWTSFESSLRRTLALTHIPPIQDTYPDHDSRMHWLHAEIASWAPSQIRANKFRPSCSDLASAIPHLAFRMDPPRVHSERILNVKPSPKSELTATVRKIVTSYFSAYSAALCCSILKRKRRIQFRRSQNFAHCRRHHKTMTQSGQT